MNKIQREKANISVAFSSSLNRLKSKDLLDESVSALQFIPKPSRIKLLLRSIVRKGFNLAKPILKPLAYRARQYFVSGLREELITEIQREQQISLTMLGQIQEQIKANTPRVVIPCAQNEVIVGIEAGYLVCSTENQVLLTTLVSTGDLERGTRRLIQRFLCPHSIFVDVGANIGIYTLAAAKALEGKGKIFVFESSAGNRQLLEKTLSINNLNHLTKIHEDALVRLDETIPQKQRVDLIRISIEDAVLEILESSQSIIKSNPQIGLIVEFKHSNLKHNNFTTAQCFKAFADLELGYKVINPTSGELEDWSQKQLEACDSVNLFLARQNSSAWKKAIL